MNVGTLRHSLAARHPFFARAAHSSNLLQSCCSRRASVGMAGSKANHYFSPRSFIPASHAREILDSLRLTPPTVAPGQTPGALRFVSLALHILPHKGRRRRRNVSARKVFRPELHLKTRSQKLHCRLPAQTAQKNHSTQQARMNSRNQTTIATAPHIVNPPFCIPHC